VNRVASFPIVNPILFSGVIEAAMQFLPQVDTALSSLFFTIHHRYSNGQAYCEVHFNIT